MDVPPTPLLPSRLGGWDVEEESLLMDQRPIFGEESMLEMSLEMSRIETWNVVDDGDESIATITGTGTGMGRGETERVEDPEMARKTERELDHSDSVYFTKHQDAHPIEDFDDHDDYYGDYPPSPFLDRSIWIRNSRLEEINIATENDIGSPIQSNLNVRQDQFEMATPPPETSVGDEDIPETSVFTDRGTKSPLASRQQDSAWSREDRSFFPRSESGSDTQVEDRSISGNEFKIGSRGEVRNGRGCGSSKRPASSPRQGQENKKSRSQSALQDDFFSRRLSRSTSSNSSSYTSYPPRTVTPAAVQTIRNSSPSNRNAQAGPSRSVPTAYESSSLLRSHDTLEMGSPAIRTSVPAPIPQSDDEEPELLPTRPSLLSRLIARSSVLHPHPPRSNPSRPSPRPSGSSATRPQPMDNPRPSPLGCERNTSIDASRSDISDIEIARSRRISGLSSIQPAWQAGTEDQGDDLMDAFLDRLPERSILHGSVCHGDEPAAFFASKTSVISDTPFFKSMSQSPTEPLSAIDFDQSSSSRTSHSYFHRPTTANDISSTYGDTSEPLSKLDLAVSHMSGARISNRRSASSVSSPALAPATSLSPSAQSAQTPHRENGTSLRQSSSQRIIGFFSDLLRSTSSRSISDQVQTPDQSILDLNETKEADVDGQSYDEYPEQGHGEEAADDGYRDPDPPSMRRVAIPGIPAPPRYIPLTRPDKVPVSHTASRAANPIRQARPVKATRPALSSSFASAALARLPPPGRGSSSAGEKIVVKPAERASNLGARRALFEKSKNQPIFPVVPGKGNAKDRLKSNEHVANRLEEKRKAREAEAQKKKVEEDRLYRLLRKETVVKAKPVPEMYRRKL